LHAGPHVTRLAEGLRAERQMGLARHWSYDLTRHAALLRAWRTEQAALRSMKQWEGRAPRRQKDERPTSAEARQHRRARRPRRDLPSL